MSAFRRNAFLIDFSNLPKLPKQEEAHLFVHQKLNLGYDDVDSIQLSNAKFALIVECATLELAINTVNKHDRKQFIEIDKKRYQIALSMDDGGTDVKIHDLPPRMDNKLIVEWMSRYGEVISIRDYTWSEKVYFKNKNNGVRTVRIRLQNPIPSYITVHGEETYVTYKNQTPTCRHCGYKAHRGRGCMENRLILGENGTSVNDRMDRARFSYADVVSKTAEANKYQERMEDTACGGEESTAPAGSSEQVAGGSMITTTGAVPKVSDSNHTQQNSSKDNNVTRIVVTKTQNSDIAEKQTLMEKNPVVDGNTRSMEVDSDVDSDDTNTQEDNTNKRNKNTNSTNKSGKQNAKHKLLETDTTDDDWGKVRSSRKKK